MVFHPTSPTRRYSDYRRAVQIKRKRTLSTAKSEKASIVMASPPTNTIPEHPELQSASEASAPKKPASGGLSRSGSLSDRLRTSWKGGVSSLLKKSQDNARADIIAKARKSKDAAATSNPGSSVSQAKASAKSTSKEPVELPAPTKSRKQTTESKHTTTSSVVDPSYSPSSKQFRTSENAPPVPSQGALGISPKQQPNSFFEHDSSDEEDESPVLQRASSVRVGKPILVRHHSNAAASQGVKRDQSPAPPSGRSQENTGTESNLDKEAEDGSVDLNLSHRLTDPGEGPEEALSRLEGTPTNVTSKPLPLTPNTIAPQISPSRPLVASPSTYGSTPTPSTDVHPTAIISPPATAATTSPGNHPQGTPFPTPLSPLSALHSNPVSPATAITSSRLSRALSAPTPPNRNPNRRVTIRPSDLIINHSDHDHKLFRDSIITTPYPERGSAGQGQNRLSDIPDGQENVLALRDDTGEGGNGTLGPGTADESSSNAKGQHVQLLDPSVPMPLSPHGPGDRDRFPSLTSSESFLLTLSIAGHPSLTTTIEIEVPSSNAPPTTIAALSLRKHRRNALTKTPTPVPFDDAALFTLLRQHYHRLIGPRRLLATRTLHHATPSTPETPLDAASFLAHLCTPTLGHDNRHWLLWLRNQQPLSKRASSMFSNNNHTATATAGLPSSTADHPFSSPTPSTYPRMPFQRSETRPAPPHIILHFRHHAMPIAAAVLTSLLVAAVAVVVWVLLGVPGLGSTDPEGTNDDYNAVREGASYGDWRVDSQMRVLTGLVLGGAVAGGGLVLTGLWVLGGWILL